MEYVYPALYFSSSGIAPRLAQRNEITDPIICSVARGSMRPNNHRQGRGREFMS
jgi:hypothetical protein